MDYELDKEAGVLHVRPKGPLRKEDFEELARAVDPYIEQAGGLTGLIVESRRFPGWEDLAGALEHVRFVRSHHEKIRKLALVTDSPLGNIAQRLATHFVAAKIRAFGSDDLPAAKAWIYEP